MKVKFSGKLKWILEKYGDLWDRIVMQNVLCWCAWKKYIAISSLNKKLHTYITTMQNTLDICYRLHQLLQLVTGIYVSMHTMYVFRCKFLILPSVVIFMWQNIKLYEKRVALLSCGCSFISSHTTLNLNTYATNECRMVHVTFSIHTVILTSPEKHSTSPDHTFWITYINP